MLMRAEWRRLEGGGGEGSRPRGEETTQDSEGFAAEVLEGLPGV